MPGRVSGVTAYIEKAAPFAQPILKHLRNLVHEACPDIEESLKWSTPSFSRHGIVCHMAAFKAHCAFGFWKSSRMLERFPDLPRTEEGMGHFGKIASLNDLPPDAKLVGWIRGAAKLNEEKPTEASKSVPKPKRELVIPAYFTEALSGDTAARETFEKLSPSHQREYVDWIVEAKRDETRSKRMANALEWLAEGKTKEWKYQRC